MKSTSANIEDMLLDVRKSYRLLHAYQRMALDAANFIGNQLGLSWAGGWPQYSATSPRAGRGSLGNWAWDWLNMVYYEFHFTQTLPDNRTLRFAMLLISDTGCFSSDKRGEPMGADFSPPEQSKTLVGFLMTVGEQWPPSFKASYDGMKAFTDNGEIPAEDRAKNIIGRCWKFSQLASEQETHALVDELIAYANDHGVPLKRVERNA